MITTLQNMLEGKLPEPASLQTEDFYVASPLGFRYVMEETREYYALGALARLLDYAPFLNHPKRTRGGTVLLHSLDPEELNNFLRLFPVGARLTYLYAVMKSLSRVRYFRIDSRNLEYQLAKERLVGMLEYLLREDPGVSEEEDSRNLLS